MTLKELSATVLARQGASLTQCPQLTAKYAFLTSSIAAALNKSGFSSTEDLVEELARLDAQCSASAGAGKGGGVVLLAAAAVAIWLLW